jgi:threonine/homoserine efflux transporter RhtA
MIYNPEAGAIAVLLVAFLSSAIPFSINCRSALRHARQVSFFTICNHVSLRSLLAEAEGAVAKPSHKGRRVTTRRNLTTSANATPKLVQR